MKTSSRGAVRAPLRAALLAFPLALVAACSTLSSPGDGAAAGPAPAASATPGTAPHAPGARPGSRVTRARAGFHEAEPAESLPPADLTPQVMFQLLASEIAAQRGEIGSATATYLSLARQTRDPRLARRATELALAERSLDRAMQGASLWRELSPGSLLAAQTLETLLLSTGKLADAEPLVAARQARARADNGLPEFYEQLQRTLMRASDKTAAFALIERVARPDESLAEARLAVAALAAAAGQHDRAAAEASKALALKPDDETAAVTAARFVAQTPAGTAAASRLLEGYLARHPRATEARFTYARLLAGEGRNEDARKQMELALREEPDNPPILFSLAQIAYQMKQLDVAEDYLKRYVGLPETVQRDNSPAYLFLAQLAEDRGRLPDAIAWLEKAGRGEQAVAATIRRALLMGKLGRVDEARELLRNTSVPTNRERAQLTAAEAQVLRDAGRPKEAFEVLDRALERLPNNPELLYDHAMAAERIDRVPVMEASLRKLIGLQPEHAHAYNALGYTFADRNIRLDEALALIEKALALSPEDPHILDSMGWVMFRLGRHDAALEYLRKAYAIRPEADVAAHLGEVLWSMGRAEDARKLWREARGREPENETLKETLARLNVAL
ncbi:MAG: tetratricopeptide repeat protein [Burkholderiaceae bacterium]